MSLTLDYFYNDHPAQFRYFRIPKTLLRDGLSLEAAALYGLMLERISLSARNGWTDPLGRVFIYFTQTDVQKYLHCGHNRATALMRELERFGLIERKRQGLGKPAKIYVKNLSASAETPEPPTLAQVPNATQNSEPSAPTQTPNAAQNPEPSAPAQTLNAPQNPEPITLAQTPNAAQNPDTTDRPSQETPVQNTEDLPAAQQETASHAVFFSTSRQAVSTAPNRRSKTPEPGSLDRPIQASKDTEKKEPEYNKPNPIHPLPPQTTASLPRSRRKQMDEMRWVEEAIRENIDYEGLVWDHPGDSALFDGYVALMTEACCSSGETIRLCGQDLPLAAVRKRFLSLNREHILYVRDCLCSTTAAIANIKAYTLAALYNAPATMDQYYTALAGQHERP